FRSDPVLARALRLVEPVVGDRDQSLAPGKIALHRGTEARGHRKARSVLKLDHLAPERHSEPLREVDGALEIGLRHDDGEFLASVASCEIDLPDARGE